MPTSMRDGPRRVFSYSSEGDPRELPHVHLSAGADEAEFWLTPEVSMACNDGLEPNLLSRALRLVEQSATDLWKHGMSISPEAVRFDEDVMWVDPSDGRMIGVPLARFARLLRATPAEREACTLGLRGLHWAAIDEDVSVNGLLSGQRDRTRQGAQAA